MASLKRVMAKLDAEMQQFSPVERTAIVWTKVAFGIFIGLMLAQLWMR